MFGTTSTTAYAARSQIHTPDGTTPVKTGAPQKHRDEAARSAQAPDTAQSAFSEGSASAQLAAMPSRSFAALVPGGNPAFLQARLLEVEDSLKRRTQLPASTASSADRTHLQALIALSNIEKPGLNAHKVDAGSNTDFRTTVEQLMHEGTQSARFAVTSANMGHFAAADYRLVGNKASVILFEPANMRVLDPALLNFRSNLSFEKNPDIAFSTIEMDIQKSANDCRMFSLALMRKMHEEHDHLQTLHERNIAGTLPVNEFRVVEAAKADALLPPSFMKHAHSRTRIRQYLQARPDIATQPVNKRGETLMARRMRSQIEGTTEAGTPITYNRGIEEKRRDYLVRLQAAWSEDAQGSA